MSQTSYATRAEADAYFSDLYASAPSAWTAATSTAKDLALKRATRWLDVTFHSRWKGIRTQDAIDAGTDWPRSDVQTDDGFDIDSEATPDAVKHATIEAAALDLAGTLDSLPDRVDSVARVASKTITAGSVSKSVSYLGGASESATSGRRFPRIEGILRDLLSSDGSVAFEGAL